MLRNLINPSVSRWFMVSGLILVMGLLILHQNISSFAAGRELKPEQFLTLGAGPAADARFGLGGLIATGLSAPLNGPACERGGPCGVPGLVVAARSYDGSPAAIRGLLAGDVDLALVRADVALQALQRQGAFSDLKAVEELTTLARLYTEAITVLVPDASALTSMADLRGKRLAVLAPYGGPNWQLAEQVLAAHNLDKNALTLVPVTHDHLGTALKNGEVDAAFVVDLPPAPILSTLEGVRFLPLTTEARDKLRQQATWFGPMVLLPDQNHRTLMPVLTVGIPVVLMARQDMPSALVKDIILSLQSSDRYGVFAKVDGRGAQIHPDVAAVTGLGLPLHPALRANTDESVQTPLAPIGKER